MESMYDAWDMLIRDDSIESTYPVFPSAGRGFGVALMRDRGVRLTSVLSSFGLSAVLPQFKKIKDTAMFLSERLAHGDVLPHNLVYDDEHKEISLIDVDEGVGSEKLPTRKNVYNEGEEDWYEALRYPNFLVKDKRRYTQVQLLACFLYIQMNASRDDNNLEVGLQQSFNQLVEEAKHLGESFCRLEKTKSLQWTDSRIKEYYHRVDNLVSAMEEVLAKF